jgi:hypothetical protein
MPSLLVTLVLFGLFCGGLAVVGMIADWLERLASGENVDNYPVRQSARVKLDNFPR